MRDYIRCSKCNYLISSCENLREIHEKEDIPVLCSGCRDGKLKMNVKLSTRKKENGKLGISHKMKFKNKTSYKQAIFDKEVSNNKEENSYTLVYFNNYKPLKKDKVNSYMIDANSDLSFTFNTGTECIQDPLKEEKKNVITYTIPERHPWLGKRKHKISLSNLKNSLLQKLKINMI